VRQRENEAVAGGLAASRGVGRAFDLSPSVTVARRGAGNASGDQWVPSLYVQ